ncbi:hypothetical protein ABIB57_004402 [Devosia sp. UYZn731]|uniref:hypothetical protein n=1 Tax=Devosia sp. UYZn731 TaxID=3156345 RepID=UPI003398EC94
MQSVRRLDTVEDEPLISINIEEIAADLGWQIEGCAYTESEALALLRHSTDMILAQRRALISRRPVIRVAFQSSSRRVMWLRCSY